MGVSFDNPKYQIEPYKATIKLPPGASDFGYCRLMDIRCIKNVRSLLLTCQKAKVNLRDREQSDRDKPRNHSGRIRIRSYRPVCTVKFSHAWQCLVGVSPMKSANKAVEKLHSLLMAKISQGFCISCGIAKPAEDTLFDIAI